MAEKVVFPTPNDLRTKTTDELKTELAEARVKLANLRFQHKMSSLQNIKLLQANRKYIARILTVIKEKEQEI